LKVNALQFYAIYGEGGLLTSTSNLNYNIVGNPQLQKSLLFNLSCWGHLIIISSNHCLSLLKTRRTDAWLVGKQQHSSSRKKENWR